MWVPQHARFAHITHQNSQSHLIPHTIRHVSKHSQAGEEPPCIVGFDPQVVVFKSKQKAKLLRVHCNDLTTRRYD